MERKKVSVRKLLSVQPAREGSGVPYLVAFASLPLAVGQEAGEERQVDAVVQRQQEVVGQLEAGGELVEQLPHAVQEEQEDGRLQGWGGVGWGGVGCRKWSLCQMTMDEVETKPGGVSSRPRSPPPCRCRGGG